MPVKMDRIKPKQSLGQNFLIDRNIAQKMIYHLKPGKEDYIVEIGPGTGMVTGFLAGTCGRLLLIETDRRAVGMLKERFKSDERITVVQGDVLELSLSEVTGGHGAVRVIGNIPYNITSPILFHLMDERRYISDVMLLVQNEFAHRIQAVHSTPSYGIMSVLAQTWATISYLFKVSPTVFYPRPSVDSAVIHLVFDQERSDIPDEHLYQTIVRGTFGKRRKMLRSSLRSIFPELAFRPDSFSVDLNKRPEDCSVDEFIKLTQEIYYAINRRHQ